MRKELKSIIESKFHNSIINASDHKPSEYVETKKKMFMKVVNNLLLTLLNINLTPKRSKKYIKNSGKEIKTNVIRRTLKGIVKDVLFNSGGDTLSEKDLRERSSYMTDPEIKVYLETIEFIRPCVPSKNNSYFIIYPVLLANGVHKKIK